MVQNEFHQDNQKYHPQETNWITRSTSSCTNSNLEDCMEPSTVLGKCRPRCCAAERTCTTGDHTGTKSCKEWRQVHDSDQNTIQCSNEDTKYQTEQHSCCNRPSVASYHCSSDQCVTNHTSSDWQVYTSSDKWEGNTDCHQKIIVGEIEHTQKSCILSELLTHYGEYRTECDNNQQNNKSLIT